MGWRRVIFFAPIVACGLPGTPGVLGKASFEPAGGTKIATGSFVAVRAFCDAACVAEAVDTSLAGGHATTAGFEAFIARDTKSKTVIDFVYLDVRDPDALTLEESTYVPATKTIGAKIAIDATLFAKSERLSGDYRCTWAVSDPSVATDAPMSYCAGDACANQCIVGLVGAGNVTITATCLGQSSSLSWSVTAAADASADGDAADD